MMLRPLAPVLALIGTLATARALVAQPTSTSREEFVAQLGMRSGEIVLDGGVATLKLPEEFRFISHEGAKLLLEEGWGNPPGAADGVLGMILPAAIHPLDDASWGVVIEFNDDGYVDDKEATSIDFNKLLAEMQEGTLAGNAERKEAGYPEVRLLGWAEPPSYNAETHKFFWAKELEFGGNPSHTLNYYVRILGRRGVLELNAVSGMNQIEDIRRGMQQLLGFVEFNDGHRYADYLPGKDKAATYGLIGLVAGAAATKAGFFKVLLAGLLAAKKFIIVGAIALVGLLKRFFGAKKPEPQE